jgi:hypothetical protein
MPPIRILVVGRAPTLAAFARTLETGATEVFTAVAASGAWLNLGRLHPDLLVLDPGAGDGRPEEWKRAIESYRRSRPLGVLLVGSQALAAIPRSLRELADLGICGPDPHPQAVLQWIREAWDEDLSGDEVWDPPGRAVER